MFVETAWFSDGKAGKQTLNSPARRIVPTPMGEQILYVVILTMRHRA